MRPGGSIGRGGNAGESPGAVVGVVAGAVVPVASDVVERGVRPEGFVVSGVVAAESPLGVSVRGVVAVVPSGDEMGAVPVLVPLSCACGTPRVCAIVSVICWSG